MIKNLFDCADHTCLYNRDSLCFCPHYKVCNYKPRKRDYRYKISRRKNKK